MLYRPTCNTWNQHRRTDDLGKISFMALCSLISLSTIKYLKMQYSNLFYNFTM